MENTSSQTALDEKLNELSADKRELLELFLGDENLVVETERDVSNQTLSEVEMKLKNIWEEVLNLGSIGSQDNFFALGGDSLHCIQIIAKARKKNLNFSTADLFEAQTIEKLAHRIGESVAKSAETHESEKSAQFAESGLNNEELLKLLQQV